MLVWSTIILIWSSIRFLGAKARERSIIDVLLTRSKKSLFVLTKTVTSSLVARGVKTFISRLSTMVGLRQRETDSHNQ